MFVRRTCTRRECANFTCEVAVLEGGGLVACYSKRVTGRIRQILRLTGGGSTGWTLGGAMSVRICLGGAASISEKGVPDVLGGDRFVAEDSGDVGREFSAVENPDSLLREKLVGRFVPRYGNLLRVLPFFGLPRSLYAHPVVEVVAIVPREPVLALCKAFIVTELTSNEYAALVESNVPSESLLASCITVH